MKKILISLIIFLAAVGVAQLAPLAALAQPARDAVCDGIALTGGAQCDQNAESEVSGVLETVINLLSLLVGVAAVIMVIIGGFKYVTSSGDPAGTNSAKNTILFAIIGLVIVALAQVIVRFVLDQI